MHDFPVYIFICPPYSLPKPATEAKSASSFILSRPHRLLEGARFETAESHSFLLAPIQRVGDEHSETEGASAKIKKILTSFQKSQFLVIYIAVPRYLYSRGTRRACGFDRSCSIYFPDAHKK